MMRQEALRLDPIISLPPATLTWSEPIRAFWEMSKLALKFPSLLSAPRGDGHSVLVIPGFATSDTATFVLRRYLDLLGYQANPWLLGINTGFKALGKNEIKLRTRLREIYNRSGRPVSLVGWSLGGIMCRLLARDHPEMVREVILIGSPFTGDPNAIVIRRLYELISGEIYSSSEGRRRFERDRSSLTDKNVHAIYSKSDGITAWENCLEEPEISEQSIEIRGSHLGMTHNPQVYSSVAAILGKDAAAVTG